MLKLISGMVFGFWLGMITVVVVWAVSSPKDHPPINYATQSLNLDQAVVTSGLEYPGMKIE